MRTAARILAPLLLALAAIHTAAGSADASPRPGKCWAAGYYNDATTVANPEVDLGLFTLDELPTFELTRCNVTGIRVVVTTADTAYEVAALEDTVTRADRDDRYARVFCQTGPRDAYSVELTWASARIAYRAGEADRFSTWADRFAARRGCEVAR